MSDSTPYSVPREPGRWRAIFLAAVVHAALLAFLWIGIRWQNETPTSVDAEVWDLKQKDAAPVPQVAPPPPPPPVQKEEPKPVVKAPPPPKLVTPPVENPDIAIEREKKQRQQDLARRREEERQEKLAEEKREKVQAEKQAEKQREKQAEARAAQAKVQAQAQAEEKRRDEKRKEEQRKKQLAEEQQKKLAAADAKAADDRRKQDLNRLQNQANAGTGGSGNAARSQGLRADSGYVSRVGAKIKSNTAFNVPDDLSDNSAVEYSVELLPDGSVRSVSKLKGSGIPGFDEAVSRAIQKSAPFPPDKSGAVPSGFTLIHRPKDSRP